MEDLLLETLANFTKTSVLKVRGKTVRSLYHLTPSENLSSIMEYGLDPEFSNSSSEAIYLALTPGIAKNYAVGERGDSFTLLEIDVSKLNPEAMGPDDYELADYIDNPWNPKDKNDYEGMDWRDFSGPESLKMVGQMTYYETIPPDAIKVLE